MREHLQPAAGDVPHRGGDGAAGLRHARHLPDALVGVAHPGDDQRAHRRVEGAVVPGQRLGDALAHVRARDACLAGSGEVGGGVDRGDVVLADAPGELDGERARAAADVEDPHTGAHAGGIGELRRQPGGIAAHEAVVVLDCGGELGHGSEGVRGRLPFLETLCDQIRPFVLIPGIEHLEV